MFSDGDYETSLQHSCVFYLFVIATVVTGSIIIGGLVGNRLAFLVFWKDTIKSSASFLFQSLALVDSSYLLLTFPVFPVPAFVTYTNWLKGYEVLFPYLYVYIQPLSNISRTVGVDNEFMIMSLLKCY